MDLQTLSARVTELAKTLSGAKARRASLALPALAGNASARKEIAEIDAQLGEIKKESALLSDGIEQLKLQAAEQAKAVIDKEQQKREAAVQKLGAQILMNRSTRRWRSCANVWNSAARRPPNWGNCTSQNTI